MRLFRWLSAHEIPDYCDLRRCGWTRAPAGAERPMLHDDRTPDCPALAELHMIEPLRWVRLLSADADSARAAIVLVGVDRPEECARLLRLGFGDVMSTRPSLAELDARMERVGRRLDMVPARRCVGGVVLDLLARDGFVGERPVGLLPREFALVWRLAEPPLRPITRVRLMQEVWRLNHVPETNSLAVHVCRLRAKLARAGCGGLVETLPDGSYRLAPEPLRESFAAWRPAWVDSPARAVVLMR